MTNHRISTVLPALALAAVSLALPACADTENANEPGPAAEVSVQVAFETPDAAIAAIAEVVDNGDRERAEAIFGSDGIELLRSGDEVADRNAAERVLAEIREKVGFEDGADGTKIAVLGTEGWPFPVPLVHSAAGWRFDVEAGWDEIENRRVGRNELLTIATMHAFVDAQREYAAVGRDGQPRVFARKVVSSEGKHDGLYWPVAEGQPESPFGPEVAAATAEGYHPGADGPIPYHGYRFRLLTAQGRSAPGGAKDYVDRRGLLTGGFAVVAWPAKYGNSGVMTFVVNHVGVVFQKDLGPETETAAAAILAYDPDATWDPARAP